MGILQSLIGFLGRALFSIVFIAAGLHNIFDWQGAEQQLTQTLTDWLPLSVEYVWFQQAVEWGVSQVSPLLLGATICELLGGLMVFLGISVRLGAFLLLVFLVPTTFLFHHFWLLSGVERDTQLVHFLLNSSLLGALLFLIAYGKGCNKAKKRDFVGESE